MRIPDDAILFERDYMPWLPMFDVMYAAAVALQGKVKYVPEVVLSPRLYRRMQEDAGHLGQNPLAMKLLKMDVYYDERVKPWRVEIRAPGIKGKTIARMSFNVLGLLPELKGKEKVMVTCTKGNVVCSLTGTEGPGVQVVLEGPGGGVQFALCAQGAQLLGAQLLLSGLLDKGADLEEAPEPMKADEVPVDGPVVAGGEEEVPRETILDVGEEKLDNPT